MIVISLPLSYVLTQIFHLPIIAVWLAIVAGNVVSSIIGYFWITRALGKVNFKEAPV